MSSAARTLFATYETPQLQLVFGSSPMLLLVSRGRALMRHARAHPPPIAREVCVEHRPTSPPTRAHPRVWIGRR
jgi:hypothetical protein